MCGICGIYNFNREDSVKRITLKSISDTMKHRGPDDEGYYVDKNMGLGHKRLSIIDIQGGHQPMSNEDDTIWIVQNGEIYNYLELRSELSLQGHKFKTHSDTEVIIHLYERYGIACLNKLNGMFAFCLWDKKKRILFLARDRFGIKPLYYYLDDDTFIFASEIKAILKKIKPELNQESLNDYLTFQFCLGDKTLFKGIKKLLPGHRMVIKGRKLITDKYWKLDFNINSSHNEEFFSDRLKVLLEDAVRLTLRSDVPIGAHLSGGLDSSTIVCYASSLLNSRLKTFTGAFRVGKEFDETSYARIISRFANTIHQEIFLRPSDFIKSFQELIYFLDEPVAGPGAFPQYFVSKLASKNVKVVLGGQGGDEAFGGYIRYLIAYFEECIRGAIFQTQDRKKFVVTFESILPNLPQLKEYIPLLQYFWQDGLFGDMDKRYLRLIRKDIEIKELICRDVFKSKSNYSSFGAFCEVFNRPNLNSLINKMTNFDIETLLPALLQVEDRTSMAVSLESRVPLLDHRIVELVASIPPTIKYKGGQSKYIFRQAVKNIVPQEILNRKDKMGFPVPLSQWYKGPLKEFVKDILLGRTTRKRGIYNTAKMQKLIDSERTFGRAIWGLLCLEMWFREFLDK